MTLLAPAWLWLLTAAPLIVLLHLRRRRPMTVPSIRLWKLVSEGSERPQRLRRPPTTLSLLLQLAILALAALTLAQPSVRSADMPATRVLIVEASAAMAVSDEARAGTRFSAAVARWLDELSSDEATGPFSAWWAGPWTKPLAFELRSLDSLRASIGDSAAADGATDWGATASRIAGTIRPGSSVTVYTTEPATARAALDEVVAAAASTLSIVDVGGPFWDLFLEPVEVSLTAAGEGSWSVAGAVRVLGEPPSPLREVTVSIGFQPLGTRSLLPFWTETVRFNLSGRAPFGTDLTLPGPGHLRVAVVSDAQDATATGQALATAVVDAYRGDDARWLHLDPAPAPLVAVVVTSLGTTSPAAKVLESTGAYRVFVSSEWPAGLQADLAVVEAAADPFVGGAAQDRPVAVLWLGVEPGSTGAQSPAGDPSVADWNASHDVSGGTSWGGLEATHAVSVSVPASAEALVTGVTQVLVQARAGAAGRDVIASFDPRDAAWVESSQFVTFVVDAVAWLAPTRQTVSACQVGVPCPLPWALTVGGIRAELGGSVAWELPARPAGPLPSNYSDAWLPDRAGLWELISPGGTVTYWPVQVASSTEPALRQATGAALAESGDAESLARGPRALGLLLLALCALLIVESAVAGRRDERFWLPQVLAGPGTSGRRARSIAAGQVLALLLLGAALLRLAWPTVSDARTLVVAAESLEDATALLPSSYADWPDSRVRHVPLVTDDGAVDAARALELAVASITAGEQLRIALVPPASPTRSLSVPLLNVLGAVAAPVDSLAAPGRHQGDVAVSRFAADRVPMAGGAAELHAVLTAQAPTVVALTLSRDGETVAELRSELLEGATLVRIPIAASVAGEVRYSLWAQADGDPVASNDSAALILTVREPPRIALYAHEGQPAAAFKEALELQGFTVTLRPPHTMGLEASSFLGYDGVVLMDVPAIDLSSAQQEALETWVREFGGGLLITGGENAFGPGGYLETALDRVSPLSSKIPREAPAVAMLFVLDRSGSMQQLVGATSRLEVAKQATLTAISLLGDGSQAAVVAYDDSAFTLLDFTDSSETETITAAIEHLIPGGGTAIQPALVRAVELLDGVDAASRHVIVLTDGLSRPDDISGVMEELVAAEATVSAIAIGAGSDVERVRQIARLGGGTAHTTTDFRALPGILAQEAMLLAGDPVVRDPVLPLVTDTGTDLMTGLPTTFPSLGAFVETTPKLAATVHLSDEEGRPLLASWRYGSGRVMAFTSQAVGAWASAWSQVSAFPGWWGQWLRWTIQPGGNVGLGLTASVYGDEVKVEVTATAKDGSPVQRLDLVATATTVTSPDAAPAASTRLVETAAGRYVGTLPLSVGDTLVEVAPAGTLQGIDAASVLVAHEYMAGVAGGPAIADGLQLLSVQTGGRLLDANAEAWPGPAVRRVTASPAYRPWMVLALAVWGLGLVMRYTPATWLTGRLRTRSGALPRSTASERRASGTR